jgi:hypothetical protein
VSSLSITSHPTFHPSLPFLLALKFTQSLENGHLATEMAHRVAFNKFRRTQQGGSVQSDVQATDFKGKLATGMEGKGG